MPSLGVQASPGGGEREAHDGIAILQVPPTHAFRRCMQSMDAFFLRPAAEKRRCAASDGPGCQVGYMHNEAAGGEMFEAKVLHDPRWPWPDAALRAAGARRLDPRRRLLRAGGPSPAGHARRAVGQLSHLLR